MQQFYRNGRLIEWDPEKPVITCLMSVYNGQTYLREAMDSILDQTYTNFEFLIINDGSTDDTVSIIESYNDPRIRLIHNEENIGLTKSLNKGIDLAKGEYIARMDADDISLPERFERQLEYLKSNSDLAGCGSNGIIIDEKSEEIGKVNKPISWSDAGRSHLYSNSFIHSSIIIRKNILVNNKYDSEIIVAQDYELWFRIIAIGLKLANIELFLIKHREHSKSIEAEKSILQSKTVKSVFETEFQKFKDRITCAVLSHNKVDQTIACISKILSNNVKLNLWDNNSSKLTQSLLKFYLRNKSGVDVNWSNKNYGVAFSRNRQIEQIETEFILFLDNDIQISEYFFFKLFKEYLASIDADGWMIKLFNQHQGCYQAHYGLEVLQTANGLQVRKQQVGPLSYSNMFTGGAVLIRKKVFKFKNSYDENMFVGLEDYDFAVQQILKNEPLRIFCLNETEALHSHLPPLFKIDYKSIKARYQFESNQSSMDQFTRKNGIEFNENVKSYLDISFNDFYVRNTHKLRRFAVLIYRLIK